MGVLIEHRAGKNKGVLKKKRRGKKSYLLQRSDLS